MSDMVSILDGNAFVVSDKRGDIEATPTDTSGFFLNDTRFLSRWVLTLDGMKPQVMSVDDLRRAVIPMCLPSSAWLRSRLLRMLRPLSPRPDDTFSIAPCSTRSDESHPGRVANYN